MSIQTKSGFIGLVTASAETGAPQGALRIADNATLRRDGALEVRQGFPPLSIGYSQPALTFLAAHPFGNKTIYETSDRFRNTAGAALDYLAVYYNLTYIAPVRQRQDIRMSAVQRGNFYAPFSTDVLKLEAATDTEWQSAGLAVQYIAVQYTSVQSGLGSMLPAGSHVGYRLATTRTDSNGVVIRSRPTGAVDVVNAGGSAGAVVLTISVTSGPPFDYLEIYRTRTFPSNIALDDEMQLVGRVGKVVTNTYWNFTDNLSDTQRTTTLYTSPSRGGIEGANDRPPAAACNEVFRNCQFFGNTVGPQRLVVSHKYATTGLESSLTGVGMRLMPATITAGSSTLTVPGAAYLQRGMLAMASTDPAPAYRWITNISGTTVTVNGAMPASGTTGVFYDGIQLNNNWVPVTIYHHNAMLYNNTYIGTYTLTPPLAGYQTTLVIETVARGQAPFVVHASHGDEFNPPLPKYGEAATKESTSQADVLPNGLSWSQPDEPEHVPAKNTALAGDKKSAILNLVALRDAMLILKEDGIYRLTGSFPNFRIDALDPTTLCLLPSSVRRLDARVYFLANKGIVSVDEAGTVIASEPVRNAVARLVDDVRATFASTGLYRLTSFAGETGMVDGRNREYLLATGSVTLETRGDLLVFSAPKSGFTTFSFMRTGGTMGFTPTGYGVAADGMPLVLTLGAVRGAVYTRITMGAESVPVVADGSTAITITSVTAETPTSARLAYTPGINLAVGDVVVMGGVAWGVVTVINSSTIVVDTRGTTYPTTGAATVYRSITLTAQPHGFVGALVTNKLWTHVAWAYSRLFGPHLVQVGFSSATPNVAESAQTITEEAPIPLQSGYARLGEGTLLRHPVPTVHRRGWLLRAQVRLTLAFGEVLLETVLAEARENQPNHLPTHSTGST
jgi:hypothetical protein